MTIAAYRDRASGSYPITLDLVRQRSGVGFGDVPSTDILDLANVDPVDLVDPPVIDPSLQYVTEGVPRKVGNRWWQTWIVHDNPPIDLAPAVNAERDRRFDTPFTFAGNTFQSRASDRENIAGASQLAFMAVVSGAKPGNLRWADPNHDFQWISLDNELIPMDAPTVIAFARTAAARKQALTFAARALKDMDPIPSDYTDDKYWTQP